MGWLSKKKPKPIEKKELTPVIPPQIQKQNSKLKKELPKEKPPVI